VDIELVVNALNAEGEGVATHQGAAVSVPGTIPGEGVRARLERARGGSISGELARVVSPSPHRVAPRCRHFGACGGCAWQHIDYGEQLRLKQRRVERAVPPGVNVLPTLPTPAPGDGTPWGYRDKVSFVFGAGGRQRRLVMGHYRRGSRTILPVEECPVHAEPGNHLAFALRDALVKAGVEAASPDGRSGVARYVVARVSESTGEAVVTLVATENAKALRRVTADLETRLGASLPCRSPKGGGGRPTVGFHLNLHDRPGPFLFGGETRRLLGLAEVREQVGGVSYLVAPTAFFQTNVRAADVLVRVVLEALADARFARVLDLYAGVGLFALPLAKARRRVTAVEENREAMASAAAAVRLNGIDNERCRLVAARVEDALGAGPTGTRAGGRRPALKAAPGEWDAVVLDPPRQGCPPHVLDVVLGTLRPASVVYVSCSPEALARDMALVAGTGYHFERVQPVDMFPHTAHVETVVVLAREDRARAR
jgi:23S rRNA (uracil1939-C5)-methyltransferase